MQHPILLSKPVTKETCGLQMVVSGCRKKLSYDTTLEPKTQNSSETKQVTDVFFLLFQGRAPRDLHGD